MTKEQEEAIKQLEGIMLYGLSTRVIERDIKAIETVLNLIQEQQAEIKSKGRTIKALQEALKERTEERDKHSDERAKKNKIIDEMAEKLWNEHYLYYMQNHNINTKDEVKQYFERKVEE